jgi:hypothetical protein
LSAAQAAAEGLADEATMATEASYSGLDASRFAYLYGVALNAPGTGELLSMLRRQTISPGNFSHGLRKARLEPMWDDALKELANVYIGIGDIAMAIVRGILPAPSYVPVPPPTHGDKVPRYPQVQIDPEALAAKLGYSPEMLEIMVGRSGLSMAPIMAANALFRGIIGPDDYLLAIAEGDLRTEWADPVRETARQILTSGEYSEAELRGYIDTATRRANTAKHGMSQADSDLLHLIQGRPLAVHQVTTGLARGGLYGGLYTDVPEPYQAAIRESNIKEPWARLAYANRYSYPSAFVVRALLTDGALTQAEGEQIFLDVGWTPELAHKVAVHYAPKATTSADPHINKAVNQLWTTLHRSYVSEETDDTTATTTLGTIGVDPAAVPAVLSLWQAERDLIRKQLSAAQVKKAYAEQVINPATGTAWTQTDAIDALVQRGYSVNDATTLLEL